MQRGKPDARIKGLQILKKIVFDETTGVVRMNVTFIARSTGRSLKLRVVEVLEVVRGRVRRSEVFLADTAALLATLADHPAAST